MQLLPRLNEMNKKVLLLINTLGNGGAQRQIILLANELSSLGCTVCLMHYGASEEMLKNFNNLNFELVRVPSVGRGYKKYRALFRRIGDCSPDCIISFIDAPNIISGIYAIFYSAVRWIPCERNLTLGNDFFGSLWRNLLYWRANFIVSNSFSQKNWIDKNIWRSNNKSVAILNGVPDIFFEGEVQKFSARENLFLSFARLSNQKNPELLIDAVAAAGGQSLRGWNFEWYGDDDPSDLGKRAALKNMIKDHGLPVQIFYATKEVKVKMNQAKFLILTSLFEGTPNVVLEAMISGMVVIASKVSDLSYILADGRGILFDSESVDGLKSAIKNAIEMSDSNMEEMVRKSRQFACDNFSKSVMARKYYSLIN